MTLDLRSEKADFREYLKRTVNAFPPEGEVTPTLSVGFTFDQDGWILAYLDPRPNAPWDGEWTGHILPENVLPRRHWYEASELASLADLDVVDENGNTAPGWSSRKDLETLAKILGDFLRDAVGEFDKEGIFECIKRADGLRYCVEEFAG